MIVTLGSHGGQTAPQHPGLVRCAPFGVPIASVQDTTIRGATVNIVEKKRRSAATHSVGENSLYGLRGVLGVIRENVFVHVLPWRVEEAGKSNLPASSTPDITMKPCTAFS